MGQRGDFSRTLDDRKKAVQVLILGPYTPADQIGGDICRKRLTRLKMSLIEKGFLLTRLVEDFPDEEDVPEDVKDEHFLDKSYYYIDNWAEILLFVFLKAGNCLGVATEFNHMASTARNKCDCSFILSEEGLNLGSLMRGTIRISRILQYTFANDEELVRFGHSGCFSILYRLLAS